MQFPYDQLKQILRDVFALVGPADTEVEVPPGDAARFDIWHTPEPALLSAHPEIGPGVLRDMAAEQGAVEVCSGPIGEESFHLFMRKRWQWHHLLQLRAGHALVLTGVWMLCAVKPKKLIEDFGFEQVSPGLYAGPTAAWRVWIVAVGELPVERSTILLRLLGSPSVRRAARRELMALPEDAWERRVALPWLIRLSFEVPPEAVDAEDRETIMDIQAWYAEFQQKTNREAVQKAHDEGLVEGQLQTTVGLFEMRLGRSLDEAERRTLAERLRRLGQGPVGEVVLSFSADAVARWLADPSAPYGVLREEHKDKGGDEGGTPPNDRG